MELKSISHSALFSYEECPLKYNFLYVRGIKPDKKALPLGIGNAVHKVLAEQYKGILSGKTLEYDEAFNIFKVGISGGDIDFKNTTLDATLLEYEPIIKVILENPLPLQPKHIENFFKVKFQNPINKESLSPVLSGIIDLTTKDDIIVEHKTSTNQYKETNITDSFQHVVYYVSYHQIYKKPPSRILYHVIYKNPRVKPEIFDVKVDNKDVDKFFKWSKKIIVGITNDDWKSKPSYKCRWCDYKNICPDAY